jgi:hypothetical protein
MNAGEVIQEVGGLTHDRLTYFVRAGYVRPRKTKRGSLYYNNFSRKDVEIIKTAWHYISTFDMKTRSAFERAKREYEEPQLSLLNRR